MFDLKLSALPLGQKGSWHQVWAILWAEPIDFHRARSDSFNLHQVRLRHAFTIDPTLLKALYNNSPFCSLYRVVLESTTLAMTLNLLNKTFSLTAWSYENNSTCKITMSTTSRFSHFLHNHLRRDYYYMTVLATTKASDVL